MRVDGYWFNDEGVLDLFIADFDARNELASLTRTEVAAAFKRVANFFEASANKGLAGELEVTSPEYGLARQIADRKDAIRQVNLVLFSERTLSEKIQALPDTEVAGVDRKGVVKGKGVSVRVDLGGRRIIKKKKK